MNPNPRAKMKTRTYNNKQMNLPYSRSPMCMWDEGGMEIETQFVKWHKIPSFRQETLLKPLIYR